MRKCKKEKRVIKEKNDCIHTNTLLEYESLKLKKQSDEVSKLLREEFKTDPQMLQLIDQIDQNESDEEYGPKDLSETIINELADKLKKAPNGRRYSTSLKKVSFILRSYSPKAYEMLADFLPFPHEKTIQRTFSEELKSTKNNLLNLSQIKILLEKIHKIYTTNDDEIIPSVLSADGAAMNPNRGGANGFIGFEFQPTKAEYKPMMVYVQENENCRLNKKTLNIATEIGNAAPAANFKIFGFATDAEPKTNGIHKSFYEMFQNSQSFDDIIMEMKNFTGQFPIADLLHLVKAMRRKYLYNSVSVTYQSPLIRKENERTVLQQSSTYKDIAETEGTLNSMRDDLSLIIFNTENLCNLGMNGHLSFFTFEFIIVIMLTIIQSPNLTAESRIQLCRLGFYSLRLIKQNSFAFQRTKIINEKICIFLDNNNYMRMINNFLCYAYAFVNFPEQIRTSRLSSHPLELTFGGIRQSSRGDDTFDNAIHAVSKGVIRESFLNDLGKSPKPVKSRCDIDGDTQSLDWNVGIPDEIRLEEIPNELMIISNSQITNEQFFQMNVWKLTVFLKEISPTLVPNLSGPNSGTRIVNRNHNFKP